MSLDLHRSIVVEIDGSGAVVGARKVKDALTDIDRATKGVDGGLRKVGDASRTTSASMASLGTAAKAAMAYFSVSTMAGFAQAVLDAGIAMDSLQRSFVAITGTQGGAASDLQFLREESDRLGQSFFTLAPLFKQVAAAARGTALEGQATRDIFSAITEASTALGMSSADTEGALRAIAQMMSKGTVQAEELRGQLGERLPGAFQIMARALGKTTPELNKMLEQGQVLADEALPALAREITKMYGAAAETAALESGQAAINKMSEAWTNFKTNLYDSDQAVAGINAITSAIKTLTEYAGLRSISETFAEGAKMAQEGKLNWEEFKRASYLDRQRMVDNGGALNTFRGSENRSEVRSVLPTATASPNSSGLSRSEKGAAEKAAREAKRAYEQMISDGKDAAEALDKYWQDYEDRRVAAISGGVNERHKAAAQEIAAIEEVVGWNTYAATAMEDTVSEAFQSMGDAIVDFATTGKASFSDFADSVVKDLMRIVVQQQIVGPLGGAAGDFLSGLFAGPSSAAGTGYAGELSRLMSASAKGNVFSGPGISEFSNTIVTQPTRFWAKGGNLMGEAGPEAIMPLKRGPDGVLGVRGGGSNVVVNVIESPGSGGRQEQRTENGVNILDIYVERIKAAVASDISSGRGAIPAALSRTYGVSRAQGALR